MRKYKALLVSSDGDWVTDYSEDSIEKICDRLNDQKSRWFFYPFHAVIIDHGSFTTRNQRIIDAAPPFEEFKGVTIKTFRQMIASLPDDVKEVILNG